MMHFYWFLLGTLCVWRVTHLLQAEDGPWDIVAYLRMAAGTGVFGKLLDCFYCLSIWVSAPFALYIGDNKEEQLLLWPSLSAGAIIMERITSRCDEVVPAQFLEDREDRDVMLREAEREVSDARTAPQGPGQRNQSQH